MTGPRLLTEEIDLETIAVGDHVTSRWTRGATVWRVTHVGWLRRSQHAWEPDWRLLTLEAIQSGATTDRPSYDLVKVINSEAASR